MVGYERPYYKIEYPDGDSAEMEAREVEYNLYENGKRKHGMRFEEPEDTFENTPKKLREEMKKKQCNHDDPLNGFIMEEQKSYCGKGQMLEGLRCITCKKEFVEKQAGPDQIRPGNGNGVYYCMTRLYAEDHKEACTVCYCNHCFVAYQESKVSGKRTRH